jgi:hypothetical protein
MYPPPCLNGFIRSMNDGRAVDKSWSPNRRDQPMLFRELRKADSFDADMATYERSSEVKPGKSNEAWLYKRRSSACVPRLKR